MTSNILKKNIKIKNNKTKQQTSKSFSNPRMKTETARRRLRYEVH